MELYLHVLIHLSWICSSHGTFAIVFIHRVKQFVVTRQRTVKAYRDSGRKAPYIHNLGGGSSARVEHCYFSWVNARSRCDFAGHKHIRKNGTRALPIVSLGNRRKWSAPRTGCINPKERAPVSVFLGSRSSVLENGKNLLPPTLHRTTIPRLSTS